MKKLYWVQMGFSALGTILFVCLINTDKLAWYAGWVLNMIVYFFLLTLSELITWGKE